MHTFLSIVLASVTLVSSTPGQVTVEVGRDSFEVPEGFQVQRVVAEQRSYFCMTLDPLGRLLLSTAQDGLLLFEDVDGNGSFERSQLLTDELLAPQGLCYAYGDLFVVAGERAVPEGSSAKEPRFGVWRLTLSEDGRAVEKRELMLAGESRDEHGLHTVVLGPDGWLYLAAGDRGRLKSEPANRFSFGAETGELLPRIEDPAGFDSGRRWPYGFIARFDPRLDSRAELSKAGLGTHRWELHSVGYRNHYDLAFNKLGELFTVDSDMEWDLGLPWYRPVRALHCTAGSDFGSRAGSGSLSHRHHPEVPAPICELGRASPTGVAIYDREEFPTAYHGNLLVADWIGARIQNIPLSLNGASYEGQPQTLLQSKLALPITDLEVAPDGSLLFCAGGRGAQSSVWRLWHSSSQDEPKIGRKPREVTGLPRGFRGEEALRIAKAAAPFREAAAQPVEVRREFALLVHGLASLRKRPASILNWIDSESDALTVRRLLEGLPHLPLGVLDRYPNFPSALMSGSDSTSKDQILRALVARLNTTDLMQFRGWQELFEQRPRFASWMFLETGRRSNTADPRTHDLVWTLLPKTDAGSRARLLRGLALQALASPVGSDLMEWEDQRERLKAWTLDEEQPLSGLAAELLLRLDPSAAGPLGMQLQACGRERGLWIVDELRILWRSGSEPYLPSREEWGSLLAFFEEASEWSGGASFQVYLAEIQRRHMVHLPLGLVREMSSAGELGARSMAALLSAREAGSVDFLVPGLKLAFADLESQELGRERQAQVLAALAGCDLVACTQDLRVWLRELHDEDSGMRSTALSLLCEHPDAEDFERHCAALQSSRQDTHRSSRALLNMDARPDYTQPESAQTFQDVIDGARHRGPILGRRLTSVLAHWSGEPKLIDNLWSEELVRWEAWFGRRFPDFRHTDRGSGAGGAGSDFEKPRWDLEHMVLFMERRTQRPVWERGLAGSAEDSEDSDRAAELARGRQIYEQAACNTCHVIDGQGAGWGPDLTGVTKRFSTRDLLQSIVNPSDVIAERFAVTVATMSDGTVVEGRIVHEGEARIALLEAGGRRKVLEREDLVSLRPSDLSAMPANLLDDYSLGEIHDLLAYLGSVQMDSQSPLGVDTEHGPDSDLAASKDAGLAESWIDLLGPRGRRFFRAGARGWGVQRDVLLGKAAGLSASEYLVCDLPHTDFELEFDALTDGNSGIQYRSRLEEDNVDPIGYQADVGKIHWGSIYATDGRGKLAGPDRDTFMGVIDRSGWNHVYLRVRGDRHYLELNGHAMVDLRDSEHVQGVFAFQLHKDLDMTVRFANLHFREL